MTTKVLFISLLLMGMFVQGQAIRPIEDFKATGAVQKTVMEKLNSDLDAIPDDNPVSNELNHQVDDLRQTLNLDELDRMNTMQEALRQENLEDRIRGHKDLELAMAEQNVDLHMGKILTDINGNRVRVEEYILRPADNQVQFLNLSMRDNRLDYVDYNAYFNTTVPANRLGLWRKDFGRVAPDVYLTKESTITSNLTDSVKHTNLYFEPTWVTATQSYVLPLKENTLHVNNILKYGINRPSYDVDLQEMTDAVGIKNYHFEFIDKNLLAIRETFTFNDDTFLTSERYTIGEEGGIRQLRWNNLQEWIYWIENFDELVFNSYKEIIITASEFDDRTIDVLSQFIHLVNVFDQDGDGINR